nr:hypothetical protein [Tanacetum cinerariifolium]
MLLNLYRLSFSLSLKIGSFSQRPPLRDARVSPPTIKESTMTPASKSLELSTNADFTPSIVTSEHNEDMVNVEVDVLDPKITDDTIVAKSEHAFMQGIFVALEDVVGLVEVASRRASSGPNDVVVALSVVEIGEQHQRLLSVKKANRGSCGLGKVGPSGERYPPNQSKERNPMKEQCKGHKHDKRRRKAQKVIKSEGSLSVVEVHQRSCMNIASKTSISPSGQNSKDVELRWKDLNEKSQSDREALWECRQLERCKVQGKSHERSNQHETMGTTLIADCKQLLTKVLQENMKVFAWVGSERTIVPRFVMEHQLKIYPFVEPLIHKRRPMTPYGRLLLKEKVFRWLKEGMIRKVRHPVWVTNTIPVKLVNGTWKVQVDYSSINKVYAKDIYPFPDEGGGLTSIMGYPYRCFLQLPKEYSQIKMTEDDEEKTGFYREKGVYCFTYMPKDLKNSTATL